MKKLIPSILIFLVSCAQDPEIAVERTFDCEVNFTQRISYMGEPVTERFINRLIDIKVEVTPEEFEKGMYSESFEELIKKRGSAFVYLRDDVDLLAQSVKPCYFNEDNILCGDSGSELFKTLLLTVDRDGGEFLYNMTSEDDGIIWKQTMTGECDKRRN